MGMKYKDPSTGQLKELSLKAADTLPIGTIVDYDGEEVPEGWEEVEEANIEFYACGPSFTAKWDCYAEVFVTAYGWGYDGVEAYLSIQNSGNPEIILEQLGKTNGHNSVPDCITSFGVYKLKKGNTYSFTSGSFTPNGSTNGRAGYVKLTPIK